MLLALCATAFAPVNRGPSELLGNADGQSPFSGVGRYEGRASCTAVLLDTSSRQGDPDAPAYAVTNGHCPDFPAANQVIVNRNVTNHRVTFNYFADVPAQARVSVAVTRVAYATMKRADVAVIELDSTLDRLAARGIRPLRAAPVLPRDGEPLATVGIPQGFAQVFLRIAGCDAAGVAPLVLEFIWHWHGLLRNGCADIRPGSSGSALVSRRGLQVYGVLNTTTQGAAAFTDCFLDHPCEPVRGGVAALPSMNYASPIVGIDRCFLNGWFDLTRPACPLEPAGGVTLTPAPLNGVNPDLTSVPFGTPRRTWSARVDGAPYYRWMVGRSPEQCARFDPYSDVVRTLDQPVIDSALPRDEGVHLLCVIGGSTREGGGAGWQWPTHASISVVRIDRTPPRLAPQVTLERGSAAWRATFTTRTPELASYSFKFGRPSETRCGDPAGYRPALVPFITISLADGPQVFCAVGYDDAFNQGEILERLLM